MPISWAHSTGSHCALHAHCLVLQLHFCVGPCSVVASSCDSLVSAPPGRPSDREGARTAPGQQQAYDQGPDLGNGERDEERMSRFTGLLSFRLPCPGTAALARVAARK